MKNLMLSAVFAVLLLSIFSISVIAQEDNATETPEDSIEDSIESSILKIINEILINKDWSSYFCPII